MTRVFRTTTGTRLDADGNSIIEDGESVRSTLTADGRGGLQIEHCRCKGEVCNCSSKRTDAEQRDDAVDRYARAIVETEVLGRNAWLVDTRAEDAAHADVTPLRRESAVDRYARAIEEAEGRR